MRTVACVAVGAVLGVALLLGGALITNQFVDVTTSF